LHADDAESSQESHSVAPHPVLDGDELLFLGSIHDLLCLGDQLLALAAKQRNPELNALAKSVSLRAEYLSLHSGLTQSRRRVLLRELRERGLLPRHVALP